MMLLLNVSVGALSIMSFWLTGDLFLLLFFL
jgi:hypothetical protein